MNGLFLALINEGTIYKANCANARNPARARRAAYWDMVVYDQARRERLRFGTNYTLAERLEAAQDLDDYYASHIAEM